MQMGLLGYPVSFLRNCTAIVRNPVTARSLECRPADWGPNPRTGRIADVSPGVASELELDTDDIVQIWIAQPTIRSAVRRDLRPEAEFRNLGIITCAEWGAAPARRSQFATHWAEGIVIHNTEGPNRSASEGDEERRLAFATAKQIQRDHFQRRFADTGQHFMISQGGLVLEGRHGSAAAAHDGMVVQGAHAGDTRKKERCYGIEICGDNRRSYVVTEPQWNALVRLCTWLVQRRGVTELPIIGHKEIHATTCPGHIMEHLVELREAVRVA